MTDYRYRIPNLSTKRSFGTQEICKRERYTERSFDFLALLAKIGIFSLLFESPI
jgi:hypothetical protein